MNFKLQRATQGFDANNLASVYKETLADGMIVAVKVFNVQMEGTLQTFDRECENLAESSSQKPHQDHQQVL